MVNETITERLVYYTCLIIDLPEENGQPNLQDCSDSGTIPRICVKCNIASKFWSDEAETVADVEGLGHLITFLLWLAILFTGFFGIVTNMLIIFVLKGRNCKGTKFNLLLSVLAAYDLVSCISSVLAATSFIACFEGWSTCGSFISTYFIHISQSAMFFSRTLSIYMTIFITIQCYLGIAYPLRMREWFSWAKIKMIPFLVLFITILLNGPKVFASLVDKRLHYGEEEEIQSLINIQYVSRWREKELTLWYKVAFALLDFLDFTLPLPTFLVFNYLSYKKMKDLSKSRKELNSTHGKDVKPIRMFLPVVTFLLVCNAVVILTRLIVYKDGILYREIYLICLFWNLLNTSANFVIYYLRGESFKRQTWKLLSRLTGR